MFNLNQGNTPNIPQVNPQQIALIKNLLSQKGITAEAWVRQLCTQRGINVDEFMEQLKSVYPDIPQDMMDKWEHSHKDFVEKAAWIKQMQAM